MKKIRLRIANNVDVARTFSASLLGGGRGYSDACALESRSNDVTPTIKTVHGFTLIVEVNEQNNNDKSGGA